MKQINITNLSTRWAAVCCLMFSLSLTLYKPVFAQNYGLKLKVGTDVGGHFADITHIAVDANGNAFVVDEKDHRIKVFDPSGTYLRSFGYFGKGDGQLQYPKGITIGPDGTVFVADYGNNRIVKFGQNGNFISTIGEQGNGDVQFNFPQDVAVDSAGMLYVADTGNSRVQVINSVNGQFVRKFGSNGPGNGQFLSPRGIAVDPTSSNIIVSDRSADRVQVFNNAGTFLFLFGSSGNGNGQFAAPTDLECNAAGEISVVDNNNDRIQIFTSGGVYSRSIGVPGPGDGQFNTPTGIAIANSQIYVVDEANYRIQVFNYTTGVFVRKFGRRQGQNGELLYPTSLAKAPNGNFYALDSDNGRIQIFNASGSYVGSIGAPGGLDGEFWFPYDLTLDSNGNIYVMDMGNRRVQIFNSNGTFVRKFGSQGSANGQFWVPLGIAVDGAGKIYVADTYNNRVQAFDNNGTFLFSFGTNGTGNGQFTHPRKLAIDGSGNIYVTDQGNWRVQIFDNNGNYLRDFGTYGSLDGQFQDPLGITVDNSGNIFVSDTFNGIQKFDNNGNFITKVLTPGPADNQVLTVEGLQMSGNDLLVADYGNHLCKVLAAAGAINNFNDQSVTYSPTPTPFDLTATTNSSGAISYSVVNDPGNTGQVTLSGTGNKTVTVTQAGVVRLRATVAADANLISASKDILLTINKANQTISFGSLSAKAYGDSPLTLNATTNAPGLSVSYSVPANNGVATISNNQVTIVGVGQVVITASQSGNNNYNAATVVQQTLTVNKGDQIITFASLPAKVQGDADFDPGATASSTLGITYSSSQATVATIVAGKIHIVGPGSTVITANQAGDANYNAASPVTQTLTVKASQTITFTKVDANANTDTKTFGDAAFSLSATASSGLSVSYTSSNASVATISGNTVTIVGAGATDITAKQAGNASFAAAPDVVRTLTVTKASQTITFATLTAKSFGDASFALTGTSTSGLALTYASSNANVATISGSTVTIVAAGSTTITATQAGDSNYNAAPAVPQTLTVGRLNQTITFGNIADKTEGDPAFTLNATASSSLAVTYAANNSKVSISNATVTIAAPGRVTITASQSGNTNYSAAAAVTQTFCIKPRKPSITMDITNPEAPVLTSSSTTGNQWYKNGVAISGSTAANYTVTAPGTYTVMVTADDCISAASDGKAIITTGLIEEGTEQVSFYPNPVGSTITVLLPVRSETNKVQIINTSGHVKHAIETEEKKVDLNVEGYVSGMYFIKVTNRNGSEIKKFIKR